MIDHESARHFALWSKGHYKNKSLSEIIAKITGSNNLDVGYKSKIYWLLNTCKYFDVLGYDIIEQFLDFESRILYNANNGYEQMLDSMKVRLQRLKVWENGSTIYDLGESNLFEEETNDN